MRAVRGLPAALTGTLRYEAVMAVRNRVAWWSLLPFCALALFLALTSPTLTGRSDPVARMGQTAMLVNVLGSMGVAVALADRMAVQRRPGLQELVDATPARPGWRAVGVVLGPWSVALAPVAAVLGVVGIGLAVADGSLRPLAAGLVGLVVIVVPGSLLLTTAANLLGLVLPVTVARVMVGPLWYWATALTPLLAAPTVTGTVFSPLGAHQAAVWLGTRPPPSTGDWLRPVATPGSALLAVGITVLTTALLFGLSRAVPAGRR